jgi:hypothetical protein
MANGIGGAGADNKGARSRPVMEVELEWEAGWGNPVPAV